MAKIAVIGSGISGMSAAYLLSPTNEVTLFEKQAVVGGHTRTKTVEVKGREIAVDTGFIVFNHINYPELVGMFRHLGIATQKSDMTFAFTMQNGAFEWGAENLNAVFAQRSNLLNPAFYGMIRDVLKFFKHAPSCLEQPSDLTLGDLIKKMSLGVRFRDRFIIPMGAAIWSCPADKMLDFPAKTFVQFFRNHGLLSLTGQHQWYTVTGGSQNYVNEIIKPLRGNVHVKSPIRKVWVESGKAMLETPNGERHAFDHIVLASHADQSLAMLADATEEEKRILGAFTYQKNQAFLHADESVMPKRRACWSSWNYAADTSRQVAVTYWMNRLQGIEASCPLFVTLNPVQPIAKDMIYDEHLFEHPVFTREAIAAQSMIPSIQGKRNLWFCGAYQRYGFHEDGLMSGVAVAKALGARVPWH